MDYTHCQYIQNGAGEIQQHQCNEQSSFDDPVNNSEEEEEIMSSPDHKPQHKTIQADDLVVQMLTRLDGPSYSQALQHDARSITDNFLAPIHFPWHSRSKLPQKILKLMPRDIDDLHVITDCQDELHAPFGDLQGPFCFGRYENGQWKGNYNSTATAHITSNDLCRDAFASARRSDDPGAIELHVLLPSPSNEGEKMLSHLPFSWREKAPPLSTSYQQLELAISAKPNPSFVDSDLESIKLAEVKAKSSTQIAIAKSFRRKWRISAKVDGVSSRATLFPSSMVKLIERRDECTRRVVRPMLCIGLLPQSVQSGLSVSLQEASAMDNAGLARSLGSYDCRIIDALLNPKREISNRVKRIEVGRTRLVWSNLPVDAPFLPSTRNREVNFNSLITGQHYRLNNYKRPREIKVGVRLNGHLIMEEAIEDIPAPLATSSGARKRKHATRQLDTEDLTLKPSVECPGSRTDEDIDAAFNLSPLKLNDPIEDNSPTFEQSVVYLEMGAIASNDIIIDRHEMIASLLKCSKKISKKQTKKRACDGSTSDQVIKDWNPPRFARVPLEDGLIRTVCLNAGDWTGMSVHLVLRSLAKEESKRMCSICWSADGSGREGVQECMDCHTLAHSNCCLDKGSFSSALSHDTHTNGSTLDDTKRPGPIFQQWKCAVCCHYTTTTQSKPRRNAQVPSRFVHGETHALSPRLRVNLVESGNADGHGPRCLLCPHRGGAMSPSEGSMSNHKWVHEVCRVWSCYDDPKSPTVSQFSIQSPLLNLCALCGTGGTNNNNMGLTKCASRGCLVSFHPMCALLASKVLASKVDINDETNEAKTVRARKSRRTEITEEIESDVKEKIAADQKLCMEYTLQLMRLTSTKGAAVIPVAFCGIHNPRRDESLFGRLPGGTLV